MSSSKKKYRSFTIKTIAFLLTLFILDFAIGSLLDYLYFNQKSGSLSRITYAIEKTDEDVLIFGSSRACHSYVSQIMEDTLNESCYNVGKAGQSMFYHYALLKSILKRYTPKKIILDIKDEEFRFQQNDYDKLSALLPYYRSHPEIRSIIEMKNKFEKYKLNSKIYPFNSMGLQVLIANSKLNKNVAREDVKGYVPLNSVWKGPIKAGTMVKHQLDDKKIKCFEDFITACKKAKVEVFICAAPNNIKSSHTEQSVLVSKKIAEKHKVKFYDYSRDTSFVSDQTLFADWVHLNDKGAKLFTTKLSESILRKK